MYIFKTGVYILYKVLSVESINVILGYFQSASFLHLLSDFVLHVDFC